MSNLLTTTNELTSIADAIRAKGGTTSTLVYPTEFVSAINDIPTGGGGGGDITPFPTSPDNSNAIIKITNIDLTGQYATQMGQQYPTIDLTQLSGQEIQYISLMEAILNLRIGKSDGMQYDVTAYFFDWHMPTSPPQYETTPWLIGGYLKYYRSYNAEYTVSLNQSTNPPSNSSNYPFPMIRINSKTDDGHMYLKFYQPFNPTQYNYNGLIGSYSIVDLYNIILLEKNNYLY